MDKENSKNVERQKFQMIKSGFDVISKWLEKIASRDTSKIEIKGAELVTIKGEKGDAGHTPTNDELLAIIEPLIPKLTQPEDGHTPTEDELLAIIRPLIPQVKDGETPSDARLIALIRPLIPEIVVDEASIADKASKIAIEKVKKIIPEPDSADEIVKKLQGVKKQWLSIEAIFGDFNTKVTRVVQQLGTVAGIRELIAGPGIAIDNTDSQRPVISAPGSTTDEKVKYSATTVAGYLGVVTKAGTGITLAQGTGGDIDKLIISSSITQYTDALAVTAIKADSAWHATNWDTAYGWGNHASAGYLTSATADSNYLKLNQGTPQTVTGGMPTFAGGLLAGDKIKFTQTDGNEYIDSEADGYMDYGATTEHRFRIGGTQQVGIKNNRAWFNTYCWFGATDTAGGYDSNWKSSFFGNSSYGYTARFTNLGSTDKVMVKTSTSNNSNGGNFGADKDGTQKFCYMDSAVGGNEEGQFRTTTNGNPATCVSKGFYGNHTTDDSSGAKTQIHGDATAIYENYYAGDPTDNSSYVDNTSGSYQYRQIEYYVYQYKSYTIGEDTVVVWSASPMYFYADGGSYEYFQVQLAWTLNGEYDGAVVYNATDGYYIDVGGASSQVDDGSYSGWTSGSPDIQNQSPYQVQTGSEYGVSANFKGAVMLSAQATPASPVNNTFWIGTDNLMHAYINDVEYTLDMTAV